MNKVVKSAIIIAEPTPAYALGEDLFMKDATIISPPDDLIARADQAMQLAGSLVTYGPVQVGKFQAFPSDDVRKSCFEKLAAEWTNQLNIKYSDWFAYFETGGMGIRYNVFVVVDKEELDMHLMSRNLGLPRDTLAALANLYEATKDKDNSQHDTERKKKWWQIWN